MLEGEEGSGVPRGCVFVMCTRGIGEVGRQEMSTRAKWAGERKQGTNCMFIIRRQSSEEREKRNLVVFSKLRFVVDSVLFRLSVVLYRQCAIRVGYGLVSFPFHYDPCPFSMKRSLVGRY